LSHEISHNIARHGSKRMAVAGVAGKGISMLALAGSAFSLAGGFWAGDVSWTSWLPKAFASSQVTQAGTTLVGYGFLAGIMAYGREQEWEADRFGHQGALAVGAAQPAMQKGWSDFQAFFSEFVPGAGGGLFASHPDGGARARELEGRYAGFAHLHAGYAGNRLPAGTYAAYGALHETLRPVTRKYGAYLREKASRGDRRQTDGLVGSVTGPGGQCVAYALGGAN
jgi:predicted Zn-dependent protease